ncbi:BadF/BadG/BcrA/BcrD ATPase family protein [Paraglaciecola sp. 2405UD69-4]|uniref:BadF/BadG/BcrA/BcrD ATPase family protein n=1 Tax=Paraglaciecola sp. 2405UD69-4 TaxID=3391836 RepID=UPI0039C907CF
MNNIQPLYVGIDGGGTKCSAHLFNRHGKVLGAGLSGSANAARNLPETLDSILKSVHMALLDASLDTKHMPLLKVAAGLAGATVPSVKEKLLEWQHPFAEFKVESDLATSSYGAHGGKDGALLIVGTGSSAAQLQRGIITQFGGHGFLLGDKGSGAWLGHSAVASTLDALDGVTKVTALHQQILNKLNVSSAADLAQKMMEATPSQFAALAPEVVRLAAEDIHASSLVNRATEYLEKLCHSTLKNTDLPLALTGGLAPFFKTKFSPALQKRVVSPKAGPEKGALYLLDQSLLLN